MASIIVMPLMRNALGVPRFSHILPIIFLLVFSVLNLALGRTNKKIYSVLGYLVSLIFPLLYLLLSGMWGTVGGYESRDVLLILSLILISLLTVLVANAKSIKSFFWSFVIFGVLTSIHVFSSYLTAGSTRGYNVAFYDYYLVVSRVIGASSASLTVYLLVNNSQRFFLIIPLILYAALGLSLGRSALVSSLLLAIIFTILMSTQTRVNRNSIYKYLGSVWSKFKIFGLVFVIGGLLYSVASSIERTVIRFAELFTSDSIIPGVRGEMWRISLSKISDSPLFGHGLGAYKTFFDNLGSYPHNMFLQVWLDGGVIPFVFLLVFTFLPIILFIYNFEKHIRFAYHLPIIVIYMVVFGEYNKALNFYVGRGFVVTAVLALIVSSGNLRNCISK